jgi:hypothetical protein
MIGTVKGFTSLPGLARYASPFKAVTVVVETRNGPMLAPSRLTMPFGRGFI